MKKMLFFATCLLILASTNDVFPQNGEHGDPYVINTENALVFSPQGGNFCSGFFVKKSYKKTPLKGARRCSLFSGKTFVNSADFRAEYTDGKWIIYSKTLKLEMVGESFYFGIYKITSINIRNTPE